MFDEVAELIASAVVEKAIDDYKNAHRVIQRMAKVDDRYKTKRMKEKEKEALLMYQDCIDFFLGDDIKLYTDLSGYFIIESIHKQYGYDPVIANYYIKKGDDADDII